MTAYTPTKAPRNPSQCWPFPCREYHATSAHQEGYDPCACPCHAPRRPDDLADRTARLNAAHSGTYRAGE